jgi:hypothetical protein
MLQKKRDFSVLARSVLSSLLQIVEVFMRRTQGLGQFLCQVHTSADTLLNDEAPAFSRHLVSW